MDESKYRILVAGGLKRRVMCAKRQNGSSESWDYLESLDDKMKKKLAVIFQRMADFGVLAQNRFKTLEDSAGICEFRSDEHRLLCFHDGSAWILTHGFPKSGQKTPKGEITRAQKIRDEYFLLKQKHQGDTQ